MKKLFVSGLISFLLSILSVTSGNASLIYNNGTPDGRGKEFTAWIVAQDFTLNEETTLNGMRFWAWDGDGSIYDNDAYRGQITYIIYGDNAGKPGAFLDYGTVTLPLNYTGVTYKVGSSYYNELLFEFTIPEFTAAANTTYYLGLHNGELTWNDTTNMWTGYHTRENFYWSSTRNAYPQNDGGIILNLYHQNYGWDTDTDIYEEAFQLLGYVDGQVLSPVPEPATILLVGIGLVGLGTTRKKFKK